MNTITEMKATVVALGQMVHTDKMNRPYLWGKILLAETQETSWVIIYDFFVGTGTKLIVYPLASSERYGVKHVEEHNNLVTEAIEMLVDRKVAFLQIILDQLEHFMYLICLVVTANTSDFFPY